MIPKKEKIHFVEDEKTYIDTLISFLKSYSESTGSGSPYTVQVTGMTGDGNVLVAMKPGAVSNPYGNISTASVNDDNLVIYRTARSVGLHREPPITPDHENLSLEFRLQAVRFGRVPMPPEGGTPKGKIRYNEMIMPKTKVEGRKKISMTH